VSNDPRTVVVSDGGRRPDQEKLYPTLTVLEGPEVGAFFALGEGTGSYTLGRADDADVQIPAPSVSRHHVCFEVVRKSGRPAILAKDNGSTNGVLVNGKSVSEMWLVSGDKLRAGDILLRFEWMSQAEVRYHRDVSNKLQAGARDHLTGLLTRSFLEQRLPKMLEELDRRGHGACCLMLDLDHFKAVNDTYGHLVGDLVLQRVAGVVQSSLRRTDFAVRYGGEEILLLMPDLAVDWGYEVAERIRSRVQAIDFSAEVDGLKVTVSVGLAQRKPGERAESWLQRADQALYRAKDGGRNQTIVSDDPAAADTDPRMNVVPQSVSGGPTRKTMPVAVPDAETRKIADDLLD
tara:strand:+ start:3253 stop:4296 length:1044 start_codon:yes stop_codon:yes gene_type:complete